MVFEEQYSDVELASEVVPVPQIQPQEIDAPEVVDETNDDTNNIPHGKPRQRKKALHASILKQMEFYFSDANLSKDRFLSELVKHDPNVDLEIFLRFNKIRSLTTDIDRIAKALSKSSMLQVSECGKRVCRVTPIVEKQNVDDCTVYVQRLPSDADHEWLISLFSKYGQVAYVSIPKFKYNHQIKGFAFIEYESPESAQKCLKALREKGCELPSQTLPTKLLSITTFNEGEEKDDNNEEDSQIVENDSKEQITSHSDDRNGNDISENNDVNEKSIQKKSTEPDKTKNKIKKKRLLKTEDKKEEIDKLEAKKVKKEKNNDDIDEESNVSASDLTIEEKRGKKRKNRRSLEDVPETESQDLTENNKKQKKMKTEKSEADLQSNDANEENSDIKDDDEAVECSKDEDNSEAKKKKKRKKKKHHNVRELLDPADVGLQVMSKRNWKKLRNKYLDLQKLKMRQLKQHMRRARWNQWGDKNKMEIENEDSTEKKENPSTKLEFSPGIIVKIELKEACVDPKNFKMELKSNSNNIKYIDVKEGAIEAFVRCDSSEAATALIDKTNDEKRYMILTGDEEKSYWDKITKDRDAKFSNKIRTKGRGRNKLLKKAEKELGKHIKFDEV